MNRLHIRIYEPPPESHGDNVVQAEEVAEKRDILPFMPKQTTIVSGRITAPIDRARILHENAACPECKKTNVAPIELQDAVISPKNRLPVPGTATIVGFHCNDCETEWPVYELTSRRNG